MAAHEGYSPYKLDPLQTVADYESIAVIKHQKYVTQKMLFSCHFYS
jgi:hypothetical protein